MTRKQAATRNKTVAAAAEEIKLVDPEVVKTDQVGALATPSAVPDGADLSLQIKALAGQLEALVKSDGGPAEIEPEAVQAMMAALCRAYSWQTEHMETYDLFSQANPVTPTDVMVTASGLLKAANLAVFELGMWQSWTGR